jgi:hypothetical protein
MDRVEPPGNMPTIGPDRPSRSDAVMPRLGFRRSGEDGV